MESVRAVCLVVLVGCGFDTSVPGSITQDGTAGDEMVVMNEAGMMMSSCFGSDGFQVCPVDPPAGDKTIPAGMIDTGNVMPPFT
jgi:hypothetical protein